MGTQSHSPVSLPSFVEPILSIGSPSIHPLFLLGDPSSDPTSHLRNVGEKNVRAQDESYKHTTTIDMLPDNVLLDIFDLHRQTDEIFRLVWAWHLLARVCQRWRQIIFTSPRRLNLRILCTYGTPVRKILDTWPAFPIVIDDSFSLSTSRMTPNHDEDNVIAALQHPDRVYDVRLRASGSRLKKMITVMQEPFPALTHLDIRSADGKAPVLPAEFLGGSVPCLQEVTLSGIPFPEIPALLVSASSLVTLNLRNIPAAGYISPEALGAGLATLSKLETLLIEFRTPPHLDQIRPPPVTQIVLPALTAFKFYGTSAYLEDLVSQIDSPQLDQIFIYYLHQPGDFQVANFSKFIDRSVGPKLTSSRHAKAKFFGSRVSFQVYGRPDLPFSGSRPAISIDWQVSHAAQVLRQIYATLSCVAHLTLLAQPKDDRQLVGNNEDVEWLHLLHQFSAVQTLHLSRGVAGYVASALEGTSREMVADTLPSLNMICLANQPASSIEKFLAARQHSDRPVTVVADT